MDREKRRAQAALRKEFCHAYDFKPEQIGFDSENSLEPIFDFDALSVLSARLCNLPHVAVELGDVNANTGIATSTGYAVLANSNSRKIFGIAQVGEVLHDGGKVETIRQAVVLSRARAMRTIHRMVGFDPVKAHQEFKRTGSVVELQPRGERQQRTAELAEIHMLAQELGLRTKGERSRYQAALTTFFPRPQWKSGRPSAGDLDDCERGQFLMVLRAWTRARAVANKPETNVA